MRSCILPIDAPRSLYLLGVRAGGELILTVFEKRLPDAIEKQPFKKILDVNYVKRVIEEADGIQPHLVAPEVRALDWAARWSTQL